MQKINSRWMSLVRYLLLTLLSIIFLFPPFWMILTSFKNRVDAFSIPPVWFFRPVLDHYKVAIQRGLYKFLADSFIVATLTTLLVIILGTGCGYTLSRFRFKGREALAFCILLIRMLPHVVLLIPVFLIMRSLKLLDTYLSIIMVHTTILLPLAIWLLRSFFDNIPKELEEAALVDGCTRVGILHKIIIPLSMPGVATVLVLTYVNSWNEFLFSLTLGGQRVKTAPVGIVSFIELSRVHWEPMFATATLIMLPVIVVAVILHKNLVTGLLMGGIK